LNAYIREQDESLIPGLLDLLAATETDMTIFFRQLAKLAPDGENDPDETLPDVLAPAYYDFDKLDSDYHAGMNRWIGRYRERFVSDPLSADARTRLMLRTNPKYVLRNYMAQVAIEKAECGDYSRIHELLELVRRPYDEQPEHEHLFYRRRPDWARHKAGCSMLS